MHPKPAVSLGRAGREENGCRHVALSSLCLQLPCEELRGTTLHLRDHDMRQGDRITSSPSEGAGANQATTLLNQQGAHCQVEVRCFLVN